jgi:hypothetical protein
MLDWFKRSSGPSSAVINRSEAIRCGHGLKGAADMACRSQYQLKHDFSAERLARAVDDSECI